MPICPALTRRNAILILLGALIQTTTLIQATTSTATVLTLPSIGPASASPLELALEFPATSIVEHAPGWTLFKDLYMSNGTFFILTDTPSDFPEVRKMVSNPLYAMNTPENIRMREPTPWNMDFLPLVEAQGRWGDDVHHGQPNRVLSIDGNTVLVNEPTQFLRHYFHFVAELFFGVQAFWHGAFSSPSPDGDLEYSLGLHPAPPLISRVIFAHANPDGWRDSPGFNEYFLRAAFPGTTIEVQEDWTNRINITSGGEGAWHFPLLLLTDRSASFRGDICGSQTQRIAAEAVAAMHTKKQLVGVRVGGWWEPVRSAVLRFAGADLRLPDNSEQIVLNSDMEEGASQLPMPAKIVITYISRQSAWNRKLTQENHEELVKELQELKKRKGDKWEVNIFEAEKLSKDEQLQVVARTTVLLGIHGNSLTHLLFMQPTRISTVIEIFYPGGFAHDYQWTASALGMKHFAVWNNTYVVAFSVSSRLSVVLRRYRTEGLGEGKPPVNYPDGFQTNRIPVHAPTIAKLIEDRVEGRV
ncbi:hypothetical protein MVEN_01647500 [Mycena venus]|uniref:Glycosyltransferase 61 catalytic domain-containing protein n=1 Tax=Mycena venus TaxID=2733690 RepID=A0A8H6XP18_9AGAR|nr:hypothetical protein MVEN_01647500 [Mycena venus]